MLNLVVHPTISRAKFTLGCAQMPITTDFGVPLNQENMKIIKNGATA